MYLTARDLDPAALTVVVVTWMSEQAHTCHHALASAACCEFRLGDCGLDLQALASAVLLRRRLKLHCGEHPAFVDAR